MTQGWWHPCKGHEWWDQRFLEQTGSYYNLISESISLAHIISSNHAYCQVLMILMQRRVHIYFTDKTCVEREANGLMVSSDACAHTLLTHTDSCLSQTTRLWHPACRMSATKTLFCCKTVSLIEILINCRAHKHTIAYIQTHTYTHANEFSRGGTLGQNASGSGRLQTRHVQTALRLHTFSTLILLAEHKLSIKRTKIRLDD